MRPQFAEHDDDGDADGGHRDRGSIGGVQPRASASSFGISSPGSFAVSVIPSRSLSWLAKMMTAIPAVNPTVTG